MKRMTGSFRDKCRYITSFGHEFFWAAIRCMLTKNSEAGLEYREKTIFKYLEKNYSHIIQRYSSKDFRIPDERKKPDINEPVWVMWLQGADKMQEITKLCQKSKERHSAGHDVIVLDRYNLRDYIELPDSIWELLDSGRISLSHFSDIARVKLLRDYGGFWLDASFFCLSDIEDEIFKMPFYSIRQPYDPAEHRFVSQRRWIGGAMCAQRGNKLFSFLHDFQIEYFTTENYLIDYLVMDYMIVLAYDHFPEVKEMIDAIPVAKGNCYYLCKHLGDDVSDDLLQEVANKSSFINKLDWRTDTSGFSEKSLYNHLKAEYDM